MDLPLVASPAWTDQADRRRATLSNCVKIERWISFDQGRTGHSRRKPTSLVTNLPHMEELHQLRGGGITGELSADLGVRIRSSKTWAEWSPGLVAAIQESLRRWTALAKSSGGSVGVKKMDLESWKKHVLNQHQPFRRDCRRCMELMGRDSPHHRTSGDRASHVLTMDIVGPLPSGDDVGWAPGNGIPPI